MKNQPVKKRPSARARTPWAAGQHPVTWPGEPFSVRVTAVHPQMACLVFTRSTFEASGYLSLADLKDLHDQVGRAIESFEESLARLEEASAP